MQDSFACVAVGVIIIGFIIWSNHQDNLRTARREKIEDSKRERQAKKLEAQRIREEAKEQHRAAKSHPNPLDDLYKVNEDEDGADVAFHRWLTGQAPTQSERRTYYVTRYMSRLAELSPKQFEQFVYYLFKDRGFKLQLTKSSGDEGIDLIGTSPEGEAVVIQCKRYKHAIGQPIVRDFYGAMIHAKAKRGYIITTSHITTSAHDWARGKSIDFIDSSDLANTIQKLADDEFDSTEQKKNLRKLSRWIPPKN